jgi:hypothetical protein
MPFPFLPGGVLLAIAVLGGAFLLFGLALRAMDRAIETTRRTMLPGLVSGFRTWATPSVRTEAPDGRSASTIEVVELVDRPIARDERASWRAS